jgi:hypothetical protein
VTDPHEAVSELIQSNVPAFGPVRFDEEGEAAGLIEGALLCEWVVMASWVDPETGESVVTRHVSSNLPHHHLVGLLTAGLDNEFGG